MSPKLTFYLISCVTFVVSGMVLSGVLCCYRSCLRDERVAAINRTKPADIQYSYEALPSQSVTCSTLYISY